MSFLLNESKPFFSKRLNSLYPFSGLLLGMFVAQVLATAHVYSSNTALFDSLIAIKDAGYLTIPNQNVMPGLKSFSSAFYGGLFYVQDRRGGFIFFSGTGLGLGSPFFPQEITSLYVLISMVIMSDCTKLPRI